LRQHGLRLRILLQTPRGARRVTGKAQKFVMRESMIEDVGLTVELLERAGRGARF
jgi:hypothetical protein